MPVHASLAQDSPVSCGRADSERRVCNTNVHVYASNLVENSQSSGCNGTTKVENDKSTNGKSGTGYFDTCMRPFIIMPKMIGALRAGEPNDTLSPEVNTETARKSTKPMRLVPYSSYSRHINMAFAVHKSSPETGTCILANGANTGPKREFGIRTMLP